MRGGDLTRISDADVLALRRRMALPDPAEPLVVPIGRPPECWCGGAGGSGVLFVPGVPNVDEGRPFATWDRFCGCSEGQEAERQRLAAINRREQFEFERRRLRVWGRSGVPAVFDGCTLDTWAERHVLRGGSEKRARNLVARLRKWSSGESGHTNLALIGSPGSSGAIGSGKTGLAVALMWEIGKEGSSVQFANVVELMLRLRATFDRDGQERERELMALFESAGLLVLDDLGKHQRTDYARATLYRIADARYTAQLPTIITANVDEAAELEAIVDEATYSRLMYRSQTIQMDNVNLRAA